MTIDGKIKTSAHLEEMAPRNLGRVFLSWRLLREMLGMPGLEIRDVHWDPSLRAWECVLEGLGMPEVGEADAIPVVHQSYETHRCGHKCDLGSHEKWSLA